MDESLSKHGQRMIFSESTSVQFSIFTLDDELQAEQLFGEAFGGAPDETQSNRTPSPQKNFLSVASSVSTESLQSVRVSPGRIDLQIAAPEPVLGRATFATIDAASSIEKLLTCVGKIDFREKNFLRLALNATLIMRQKNLADAREAFYELTQFPKLAPDLQDLLLQLNRRRKLGDDLEINRLVQYMTFHIQIQQLQLQGAGISPAAVIDSHASGMRLDFNTVPGTILITPSDIVRIFHEICKDVKHAISHPLMTEIFRE